MIDAERLRKLLTPGASLRDDAPPKERKKSAPDAGKKKRPLETRETPEIFIAVASKENYLICRQRNIYAVKRPSLLDRVMSGDIIVFYVAKHGEFPGIYRVTRTAYQANSSPFDSVLLRYFIDLTPVLQLPEGKWLKLTDVAGKLAAVKDKRVPPGKYFQTMLRSLSEGDYKFLSSRMAQVLKQKGLG